MKKVVFKKMFLIFILLIIFPIVTLAKYAESITNTKATGVIAESIFNVVEGEQIITEADKYMETQIYTFSVNNYKINSNGEKRINQVALSYTIEIQETESDFPISIELYEEGSNVNLLNENNITNSIPIEANVEYSKNYNLVVKWNSDEQISGSTDNISIVINAF